MGNKSATAEEVARIAARQHGVVSARQLLAVGLGRSTISKWAAKGRLHRIHRGVYAVGHAGLSIEGRWMGAVLACGDGAVLSHRSAAALWGLLRPFDGPVEVSVASYGGRRRREGIRLHRCASLARRGDDGGPLVTRRRGIPATTPARTIADLRGVVSPRLHRRAIRQAELAGFALDPNIRTDGTRSDLETDFLALCRRAGLPKPEVNVRIGRWTVDFLWPVQRLAVETDSYRFHRGAVAFEDDRARDLGLRARGLRVRRFSERQVRGEAAQVAADLRDALGLAS
jgi:very-short-patch-repair endonuclease